MSRTFIYHPEEGAKIVAAHEAQEYYDKGWFDSPAKFGTEAEVEEKIRSIDLPPYQPEEVKKPKAVAPKPRPVFTKAASGLVNVETVYQPRKK